MEISMYILLFGVLAIIAIPGFLFICALVLKSRLDTAQEPYE